MKEERIIFHIDDDDDDRDFFAEALRGHPQFKVLGFASFDDALRAALSVKPDVICMDFWVPGMTASQFLKSMAALTDLAHTNITVLSGTEVPEFFRELLDRYHVKYDVKPDNERQLKELLLKHLHEKTE